MQSSAQLFRRLLLISPKGLLAGVLVAGFALTLPFWLISTPEEKQRVVQQTTAAKAVEQDVGPIDIEDGEREKLRRMLQGEEQNGEVDFEEEVWMQDIRHLISPWVKDAKEAEKIARSVYAYSRKFDLSPELVLGVIAVESRFDHFAVSNVGARGLMQVMPFWREEIGNANDDLFIVETNLRYGCAILRHYLDRSGGNMTNALAAYNGSRGQIDYPARVYAQMRTFKASRGDG